MLKGYKLVGEVDVFVNSYRFRFECYRVSFFRFREGREFFVGIRKDLLGEGEFK